jgi:hypothetical protein
VRSVNMRQERCEDGSGEVMLVFCDLVLSVSPFEMYV